MGSGQDANELQSLLRELFERQENLEARNVRLQENKRLKADLKKLTIDLKNMFYRLEAKIEKHEGDTLK